MKPPAAKLLQILLFSAAWFALATGVAGQSSTPRTAPSRAGDKTRAVRAAKPAPVLSDGALEKAILQRFRASKIGSNGFTVRVAQGVATLGGSASVAQHKGMATRLARLAGARTVVNQIQLSEEARERMRNQTAKRDSRAAKPKAPPPAPRGRVPPPDSNRADTSAKLPPQPATAARPPENHTQESGRAEPAAAPSAEAAGQVETGGVKRFRVLPSPDASPAVEGRSHRAAPRRY